MSKFLKKPVYEKRALELQLINSTIQIHDLTCGCEEPLKHLDHLIKKCLTTTEDHGTTTGTAEEEHFDAGDLDRLFAEDVFDEG